MKALPLAALALVLGVATAQPTMALSTDEAHEIIVGEWVVTRPSTESWVFTKDGEWVQYRGGKKFVSAYTLEGLPANLIKLVSKETGKTYIIHTTNGAITFNMFEEGSEDLVASALKSNWKDSLKTD